MKKTSSAVAVALFTALSLSAGVAVADSASAGASVEAEADTGFFGRLFGGSKKEEKAREEKNREKMAEKKREMEREEAKKRREMEREEAKKQREMADKEEEMKRQKKEKEREMAREQEHRADPAERGKKKGWVDGMPPGQAKKAGKGKDKMAKHRDQEDEASSEMDPVEQTPEQEPVTAEGVMRDMAKDKAVRASGAAEGSAEEALIRMGTDIMIDKAKNRGE